MTIFYSKIPINKYRKNLRNRKLQFRKHQSNNCCRQESSMDAKISGKHKMRNRKLAYHRVFPRKILINYKGKTVTLQ